MRAPRWSSRAHGTPGGRRPLPMQREKMQREKWRRCGEPPRLPAAQSQLPPMEALPARNMMRMPMTTPKSAMGPISPSRRPSPPPLSPLLPAPPRVAEAPSRRRRRRGGGGRTEGGCLRRRPRRRCVCLRRPSWRGDLRRRCAPALSPPSRTSRAISSGEGGSSQGGYASPAARSASTETRHLPMGGEARGASPPPAGGGGSQLWPVAELKQMQRRRY